MSSSPMELDAQFYSYRLICELDQLYFKMNRIARLIKTP